MNRLADSALPFLLIYPFLLVWLGYSIGHYYAGSPSTAMNELHSNSHMREKGPFHLSLIQCCNPHTRSLARSLHPPHLCYSPLWSDVKASVCVLKPLVKEIAATISGLNIYLQQSLSFSLMRTYTRLPTGEPSVTCKCKIRRAGRGSSRYTKIDYLKSDPKNMFGRLKIMINYNFKKLLCFQKLHI